MTNTPAVVPSIYQGDVLFNKQVGPHIQRMRINHPQIAAEALPGQFINIRVNNELNPLWRRPFSIHAAKPDEGWFDILFRVLGKGTQELTRLSVGDALDFVGPLGNHFSLKFAPNEIALLVGGGLGIAPMVILAEQLKAKSVTPVIFYGVREKAELCSLNDLQAITNRVNVATEDGSQGYRGYVTDLVDTFLSERMNKQELAIYACGPNPMLARLGQIAEYHAVSCQVSLETLMGCGIGACLGCGMKTKNSDVPYLYVCKAGPVFQAKEIDFRE